MACIHTWSYYILCCNFHAQQWLGPYLRLRSSNFMALFCQAHCFSFLLHIEQHLLVVVAFSVLALVKGRQPFTYTLISCAVSHLVAAVESCRTVAPQNPMTTNDHMLQTLIQASYGNYPSPICSPFCSHQE